MCGKQEAKLEKEKKEAAKINKTTTRTSSRKQKSTVEQILGSAAAKQAARTISTSLVRGLLGMFMKK